MQDNLIFTGIKEYNNEKCKKSVENVLENVLDIIITDEEVKAFYQTGSATQGLINGKKYITTILVC